MRSSNVFTALLSIVLFSTLFGSAGASNTDYYLGSEYKSNYVWGLAMNMAWHELSENILHGKVKLKTGDEIALRMADQFNEAPFTKNDLDEKSYYIKSGYGQKTVDLINKESRAKFPDKSFEDLKLALGPKDIIAYAYFLKKVEYLTQFKEGSVWFEEKEEVKGFYAHTPEQKDNVEILNYWDDDRFIICLKLKGDEDEIILAKGFEMDNPRDALDEIAKYNKNIPSAMSHNDQFEMPKLHLDHHREYDELKGRCLANKGFEIYCIVEMFENIKFDMDHKGARVENEGVIAIVSGIATKEPKIRRFILNKPFWVVMKRKNNENPYFILGVRNTKLMEKS